MHGHAGVVQRFDYSQHVAPLPDDEVVIPVADITGDPNDAESFRINMFELYNFCKDVLGEDE